MGSPRDWYWAQYLFNIFISDPDEGIKCKLMKFADDTELSREMDTAEGRTTLQEGLDRLEEIVNKKLMKFNKDKCKGLLSLFDLISSPFFPLLLVLLLPFSPLDFSPFNFLNNFFCGYVLSITTYSL